MFYFCFFLVFFVIKNVQLVGVCSTAEKKTPCDRDIVGSNPWAFFPLYLISSAALIWSLTEVQHH